MSDRTFYSIDDNSRIDVLENESSTVRLSVYEQFHGSADIELDLDTLKDLIYHLQHVKHRMIQAGMKDSQ